MLTSTRVDVLVEGAVLVGAEVQYSGRDARSVMARPPHLSGTGTGEGACGCSGMRFVLAAVDELFDVHQ